MPEKDERPGAIGLHAQGVYGGVRSRTSGQTRTHHWRTVSYVSTTPRSAIMRLTVAIAQRATERQPETGTDDFWGKSEPLVREGCCVFHSLSLSVASAFLQVDSTVLLPPHPQVISPVSRKTIRTFTRRLADSDHSFWLSFPLSHCISLRRPLHTEGTACSGATACHVRVIFCHRSFFTTAIPRQIREALVRSARQPCAFR